MYKALVCKLKNVRPHPNADRINLATVYGHQVVVGKDQKEETLGIFFPCDGVLSHPFLMKNNLYRKHPETGQEMGGFFDSNRRVRAQAFRGEKSDGFWVPISFVEWTKAKLKEGDQFDTLNGHLICEKYYTPETKRQMAQPKGKRQKDYPLFLKHFETKQLKYYQDQLPERAIFIITEKLHGTSGRTTRTLTDGNWFDRLLKRKKWEYVSGSRRVILQGTDKYYEGSRFRNHIHEEIKSIGLRKGETLYYEIVGFTDTGKAIMPPHGNLSWKYECSCDNEKPYAIYIYRITLTNEDGDVVELSWEQIKNRCKELGLKYVPEIDVTLNKDTLPDVENCKSSFINQPLEGIVIRVEGEMFDLFKDKTHEFKVAEGIIKNDDKYVDLEEIS